MHASEMPKDLIALRLRSGSRGIGVLELQSVGGVRGRIWLLSVFLCIFLLLECIFDAKACDLSVERLI